MTIDLEPWLHRVIWSLWEYRMRSLLEILASTITALRETPPPGEARCKHAEQTVAAGGGKEKRKNKALEKNIFVFCQKVCQCSDLTISLTDSVLSTRRWIARILDTASVGITLVSRGTGAHCSVASGSTVCSGSTGWGNTGVSGDGLSLLLSEDTNGSQSSTQTIVDHSGWLRSGGGESDGTTINSVAARSVVPASLTPRQECSSLVICLWYSSSSSSSSSSSCLPAHSSASSVDLTVSVDTTGRGRTLGLDHCDHQAQCHHRHQPPHHDHTQQCYSVMVSLQNPGVVMLSLGEPISNWYCWLSLTEQPRRWGLQCYQHIYISTIYIQPWPVYNNLPKIIMNQHTRKYLKMIWLFLFNCFIILMFVSVLSLMDKKSTHADHLHLKQSSVKSELCLIEIMLEESWRACLEHVISSNKFN